MGGTPSRQEDVIHAFDGGTITGVRHVAYRAPPGADIMSGTPARLEFTIAQENKTVRAHFLSSSPSFRVNGVRALEHRPQSLDMMVSGLPMVVQRVGCVRTDGLAAETVLKFSLDGGLAYEVTGVDRAIVAEAKTEDELAVLRKRKEAIEERIMELEEQSMGVQYC